MLFAFSLNVHRLYKCLREYFAPSQSFEKLPTLDATLCSFVKFLSSFHCDSRVVSNGKECFVLNDLSEQLIGNLIALRTNERTVIFVAVQYQIDVELFTSKRVLCRSPVSQLGRCLDFPFPNSSTSWHFHAIMALIFVASVRYIIAHTYCFRRHGCLLRSYSLQDLRKRKLNSERCL